MIPLRKNKKFNRVNRPNRFKTDLKHLNKRNRFRSDGSQNRHNLLRFMETLIGVAFGAAITLLILVMI